MQNKWQKKALTTKKSTQKYTKFNDFVDFLSDMSNDMSDPYYGQFYLQQDANKHVSYVSDKYAGVSSDADPQSRPRNYAREEMP